MTKKLFFFLSWNIFLFSFLQARSSLFYLNSDSITFLRHENAYQPDVSDAKVIPIPVTLFYKIQERTSAFLVISEGGKINFDQKLTTGYDNSKVEYNHASLSSFSDYRHALFRENRLRYNFYSDSLLTSLMHPYWNIRYPQDALVLSLSPLDHQLNMTVYLHVPLGQYVPPGLYKDVVYMTLFVGDLGRLATCEGVDNIEHMISINVSYRMSLTPYKSYLKDKETFFSFMVLTNESYVFEVETSHSLFRESQENPSATGNIHTVPENAKKIIYKSFP